jgi:hypothetical protein
MKPAVLFIWTISVFSNAEGQNESLITIIRYTKGNRIKQGKKKNSMVSTRDSADLKLLKQYWSSGASRSWYQPGEELKKRKK